jgi:hypothetical protein
LIRTRVTVVNRDAVRLVQLGELQEAPVEHGACGRTLCGGHVFPGDPFGLSKTVAHRFPGKRDERARCRVRHVTVTLARLIQARHDLKETHRCELIRITYASRCWTVWASFSAT